MSSGPENRFIQGVHAKLPPSVYALKNHNPYNGGIADCWYSGISGDLWVEYKFTEIPKRPGTEIKLIGDTGMLSTLQQNWLTDRHAEGRTVAVIVGTPSGGIFLRGVDFKNPLTALDLRQRLLTKVQLASLISEIVAYS